VDVTRLSPYGRMMSSEPEERRPAEAAVRPRSHPEPPAVSAEDRLEMVRSQNLAAPQVQPVDLTEARELLAQVMRQVAAGSRQELRQVYHYDRLRELCCRLQETGEA